MPLERRSIALVLASLCLFAVLSRFSEVMAEEMGSGFKIVTLLTVLAGITCLFSGRLPASLRNRGTIAMLTFTTWLLICVPFSVWPGGSVTKFRTEWIFSVGVFLIVAAGAASIKNLFDYAGAIAWATIFVNFVLVRYGKEQNLRGTLEFEGSLSNPNYAALYLLLGLPFLIFWVRTRGPITARGLIGLANAGLLAVLIVTRTGSRSGLLSLMVLTLLLLAGTKFHVWTSLLICLTLGAALMVPFIPNYLIYRYGTLLNSSEVHGGEAENSTNARKEVLNESLGLTLKHPVVGVGPGQFRVAAAAQSKDEGVRALWLETHNTYTQISSETGIVGLLLYLSMIFFSLVPVWKDLRLARRTGNRLPQHEYARALLICSAGLLTNCIFTSVAYQYYWPLLCGLGVAYQRVTNTRTTTATPFRLMRTPAVS